MTTVVELAVSGQRLAPHRISVEDFHRMSAAGVLAEDMRVELVEGVLVDMAPIGSRHAGTVNHLTRLLLRAAPDAVVTVQNPLVLDEATELYPDLLVAYSRADFYARSNPRASDVLLLVEVADSSIGYDRNAKIPLYARGGVPEVWIVDIQHTRVEIFRDPSADGYRDVSVLSADQTAASTKVPTVTFDVASLFPPW
jgi:Uma2 family endonuclease